MGNDTRANPGKTGVTADIYIMLQDKRRRWFLYIFPDRCLFWALLPGDQVKNRAGSCKAVFVKYIYSLMQARRQISKYKCLCVTFFFLGVFVSHILILCTNGSILLISYKNIRFDTKRGQKYPFCDVTLYHWHSLGSICRTERRTDWRTLAFCFLQISFDS